MELLARLEPGSALGAPLAPVKAVIYRQDRTADARLIVAGIAREFAQPLEHPQPRLSLLKTVVPHAKAYKEAATLRIPVHQHERRREGTMPSAWSVMHGLAWELMPSLRGVLADGRRVQGVSRRGGGQAWVQTISPRRCGLRYRCGRPGAEPAIGPVRRLKRPPPTPTPHPSPSRPAMNPPAPFQDLPSLIRHHARTRPDAAALRQAGVHLSYGELDARIDRVAATLQRAGFHPGDALAVCAGTSPDYVALFLGALRAGVVVAPLAPSSTAQHLLDMASDADAKRVFIDSSTAGLGVNWPVPTVSLDAAAFEAWLDRFFSVQAPGDNKHLGQEAMIGQYAHGNEPSHHIAYLYAWTASPWKGHALIRRIARDFYGSGPDGIIGNDDCGQMSAWLVLSTLGLYPVVPASGDYVAGVPLVRQAVLKRPDGSRLLIRPGTRSGPWLDGQPVDPKALAHAALLQARRLELGPWQDSASRPITGTRSHVSHRSR
jgi:hypothetical protein